MPTYYLLFTTLCVLADGYLLLDGLGWDESSTEATSCTGLYLLKSLCLTEVVTCDIGSETIGSSTFTAKSFNPSTRLAPKLSVKNIKQENNNITHKMLVQEYAIFKLQVYSGTLIYQT